jgi:hypothetical protein
MIERRIPPGGDPFYAEGVRAESTPASRGSTRHHRCDHEFLDLLEQDFGVARFALSLAFLGMPAEPKKASDRRHGVGRLAGRARKGAKQYVRQSTKEVPELRGTP